MNNLPNDAEERFEKEFCLKDDDSDGYVNALHAGFTARKIKAFIANELSLQRAKMVEAVGKLVGCGRASGYANSLRCGYKGNVCDHCTSLLAALGEGGNPSV